MTDALSVVEKVEEYVGRITPIIFENLQALNIGSMTSEKAAAVTSAVISQILNSATTMALDEDIKINQSLLTQKQIELTEHRIVSERAQTEDTVDGKEIKGLMGIQRTSIYNQAQGFKTNAWQKLVDSQARLLQTGMANSEGGRNSTNKFDDSGAGEAVSGLTQSIYEFR